MSRSPPPVPLSKDKKSDSSMVLISGKIAAMSGCYEIPQRECSGGSTYRYSDPTLFLSAAFSAAVYPLFRGTGYTEFFLDGGGHFLLIF